MFKIVPKFSDNGFDDDDDDDDDADDDDLKGQKYMTQETAAQNIKNQHRSSIENKKTEELKRGNQCMDNSTRTLKYHQ